MFERVKRGDDAGESPDTSRPEADKSFGALRSKATSRSNEMAVIGSSIHINGDLRGDEDLRIEGNVTGTVELKNSVLTIARKAKLRPAYTPSPLLSTVRPRVTCTRPNA